jgi:hypothetical protein
MEKRKDVSLGVVASQAPSVISGHSSIRDRHTRLTVSEPSCFFRIYQGTSSRFNYFWDDQTKQREKVQSLFDYERWFACSRPLDV